MPRRILCGMILALLVGGTTTVAAEPNDQPWWPQFHGPNRDNMSTETGLLKRWPEDGPKLAWKASGIGDGYAMLSIADGRIFTSGDFDDVEKVVALDLDGKLLWKADNGESWTGAYPGARTTPTYDDGVLYQMNPHGRLTALQADSGKSVWSVDLKARLGARFGVWAMAENVVVEGDRVLCVPGGTKALVAALDKRTGETLWINHDLDEVAAYCSPAVITYKGVRQLITLTQKSVVSIAVDTGKLLWSHPHVTRHDQNINTPLFHDGYVFLASGHSGGGRLLKIDDDVSGATEIWYREELDNCHGGAMLLDGCLYGSACRAGGKMFFCADFLTGETLQSDPKMPKLSLTHADGMLYGISNTGQVLLMATRQGKFKVVSGFPVPRGSNGEYLAHPTVCGGRLYIRHGDDLYAYDVKAREVTASYSR